MSIDDVMSGNAPFTVVCGDATEALKSIPSGSIHVCYCDPPYGLSSQEASDVAACLASWLSGTVYTHKSPKGFMSAEWDAFVPGPEVWGEAYRVLKPGAYCVAYSSTRTVDLLGIAMRLGGLEVREGFAWIQGQGFPKNLNVGKSIDKAAGATREVVGYDASRVRPNRIGQEGAIGNIGGNGVPCDRTDNGATHTAPATEAAKQWDGWGTSLKPSYEPLMVTRKPLDGTVAHNVVVHGCGALNIEGARVGTTKDVPTSGRTKPREDGWGMRGDETTSGFNPNLGRYPSNLALVHDEDCVQVGTAKIQSKNAVLKHTEVGELYSSYSGGLKKRPHGEYGYADPDGTDTVTQWQCTDTCAVAELGRQSGQSSTPDNITRGGNRQMSFGMGPQKVQGFGDAGTATRFFYQGKANANDRLAYLTCSEGCTANNTVAPAKQVPGGKVCPVCGQAITVYLHPTVKPYDLALYHAKLLSLPPHTRPIAIVPFCGTGVEARALLDVGFRVIAVDIDPKHCAMTQYRLNGEQPKKDVVEVGTTPMGPLTYSMDDLLGL